MLVGTCDGMCPEAELKEHASFNSPFEQDPTTAKFDPCRAIKSFHRSSAGSCLVPTDLRPLPVLTSTLAYIESTLLKHFPFDLQFYSYLSDRFRSIRQDLVIQSLHGAEVVSILEKTALFLLYSRVAIWSDVSFERVHNMEQLTDTFLSLMAEYDSFHSEAECFFRSIFLLLHFTEPDFNTIASLLSISILSSEHV
jgi:hypothetical protein